MISLPAHAALQMHQDAFDLIGEGVLWVDGTGRIRGANTSAARMLGYGQDGLAGVSYFEINPHFSLLGWKKFWNRISLSSEPERMDTEFINKAGKLFTVRGRVGMDLLADDPELAFIVFANTEAGRRDADLLQQIETDANIGVWEYNLTTGQVFISLRIREWLGWSPERDFIPVDEFRQKLTELLEEDVRLDGRKLLKQAYQGARAFDTQLHLRTAAQPEAPPREYSIRGRSVDNELEVYKIFGTMMPAAEPTGAVSFTGGEELLKFSLDQCLDAVYVIDYADRRIRFVNNSTAEFTGYALRELTGLPAATLAPPDIADPDALDQLYETLRRERYLELQTTTVRKDGSTIPTFARLNFYTREETEYMIVVSHDLRQQEASDESKQLHTTTLDALSEWVIWLDVNNEIVLLNSAARKKLSRKTSRDLIHLPLNEVMPDLEIPAVADVRQQQLDGRVRSTTDYIWSNPSGEDRTLQVRFAQVSAGRQLYLCVICRDITVQAANKRRLQQTKRRVDELTKQLQSENEALKEEIERVNSGSPIVTVSKKYQKILGQIAQVAGTDATVLITGETGTGKELLAQSIHNFSNRSSRTLVSVNCAALPENLIESELFGHERGAFTGAVTQKKGKFEIAHGGTIFLDEIGELPLDMQAKLLRALQEGEIQRIGSNEIIRVNVRVVAATNRNLERMISENTFREDLYYRLNVFPIHNLPLRERPEDIPVLVKHFAHLYAERMGRNITQIKEIDLEKLQQYDFPGNVRELINLVERAVITSPGTTLNLGASLRALRRVERDDNLSFRGDRIISFEEMQRQYIMETLRRTKGKVTGPGGAAELLDLNGRTLMSKMNKLGINRNEFTT